MSCTDIENRDSFYHGSRYDTAAGKRKVFSSQDYNNFIYPRN